MMLLYPSSFPLSQTEDPKSIHPPQSQQHQPPSKKKRKEDLKAIPFALRLIFYFTCIKRRKIKQSEREKKKGRVIDYMT